MPSGEGTPVKNSSSNIRQPKPATASAAVGVLVPPDSTLQASTPKRIERRRRPSKKVQPSDIPELEQRTEGLTPQQAKDQVPATTPLSNGETATNAGKKSRNKKVPNNQLANGNASQSASKPRNPRSLHPEPRATSMTPVKKTTAPSQAYAGPTFHASPAPSALPIPRFFSKSVPVTEKGASLSTMMQDDSSEGLSNKSEDSPTMPNSLRVSQQLIREASPLDFFFNADREEKAKRSSINMNGISDTSFDQIASTPKIVSPIPEHMRHHSRNATGGSTNEMFPLEMDASEIASPTRAIRPTYPSPEARRSESSPSIIRTTSAQSEEQAKAKTEALKRFLQLSQYPGSSSEVASSSVALNYSGSPSPSPLSQHNYNLRTTSATSTPRGSNGGLGYRYRTQSPDSNPPYLKQSPAINGNVLSQVRPLSSQLRQEMNAEMPLGSEELHSTPTPSRSCNVYHQTTAQNLHNVQHNNSFSPHTPAVKKFQPEDALRAATGENGTSVDMMENELRRILKLDSLGSGGATGVRF
ncbi:hypothetical protein MMC34_005372 [Xylographa carneopallida]|nr:hypothetical protein [Xylographa carneopallida]